MKLSKESLAYLQNRLASRKIDLRECQEERDRYLMIYTNKETRFRELQAHIQELENEIEFFGQETRCPGVVEELLVNELLALRESIEEDTEYLKDLAGTTRYDEVLDSIAHRSQLVSQILKHLQSLGVEVE